MSSIPMSVPLVGENGRIGTVTVEHDQSNLHIRYRIDGAPGYLMHDVRAHVAVSYDLNGIDDGIPHSYYSGMIHGRFSHQCATTGVLVHTLTIPMKPIFQEAGGVWCAAAAIVSDSRRPKSVVSFKQGPKRNGRPIAADRTDPNKVLNPDCPANWKPGDPVTFFSLGVDGHVIVDFGEMLDTAQHGRIVCWEISAGPHVTEKAKVEVSQTPEGPWTPLSPEATNGRPGSVELISTSSLEVKGLRQYRYVRVSEASGLVVNPSIPEPCYEDGFDLDGVCATGSARQIAWATSEHRPLDIAMRGQPFMYEL
jgi:hypothetical protein